MKDSLSSQPVIDYTYLSDGKVDHADYRNGVHSVYGYDGRGMINSVQHQRGDGANLSSRTYWRDERDRITAYQKSTSNSVNPMENGRGDRFRYDEEGQLVEAWYNATNPANSGAGNTRYDAFNYDALGNRRSWNYLQTHGWQQFSRKDNGLNQYRMWFSVANYDDDIGGTWGTPGHANGVLMQEGNITAGYNALNQPMLIWSAAYIGTANWMYFGYDPLGRCVKRWVSLSGDANTNPATYFYYEGWNLIQEGPSYANASRNYVHGARVDEIVKQITPNNWWERYFHYDARGHCTLQTDAGGNIVEQYEYDAFGYPYFYDAWGANLGYSPWGNRLLFTGREWLSDLKLYDFRNRMYQPELGRFMQPDPKEFAGGDYNLYRYCHNDPVNSTDPTGLLPVPVKDDVDAASRDGLLKAREIAQKSGDGFERAKSTGRDPKTGKMFVGEPTEKGRGTPDGPQKVEIPGPGRGAEPESAVHAHRNNGQTDGHDRQLPPGQTGPMASNKDRQWADVLQRAIYTISENGKMIERYRPDDSGKPNAGVTERWNGQSWITIGGGR